MPSSPMNGPKLPKQATRSQAKYLESKIESASQPELHLMLIEGAMRFGKQAQLAWDRGDEAETDRLIQRTSDIIEALVQGFTSGEGELIEKLEELYAFFYRDLAFGRINRDRARIDGVLELLAFERETWKLACDRLAEEQVEQQAATGVSTPHYARQADSLSLEA